MDDIDRDYIAQGLMVTLAVVVGYKASKGSLQCTGHLIQDLVHFLFQGLVVAFKFTVCLGVKERCLDVPDAYQVQVVSEGPGYVA